MIPPNADDQLKQICVLLGTLKCGNNNENILAEFSALLGQLYKDKKYVNYYIRLYVLNVKIY